MPLINCEINDTLSWSDNCVTSSGTGATKFKVTKAKTYVPLVTLSTQDNWKLIQQLKSGFKRKIQKYQCKLQTHI